MKEFTYNGKKYVIIKSHSSKDYEVLYTDIKKYITLFLFYPIFINNKFRCFKKVKIEKTFIIYRYSDFDSGWNYELFWKKWKHKYEITDILDIKKPS